MILSRHSHSNVDASGLEVIWGGPASPIQYQSPGDLSCWPWYVALGKASHVQRIRAGPRLHTACLYSEHLRPGMLGSSTRLKSLQAIDYPQASDWSELTVIPESVHHGHASLSQPILSMFWGLQHHIPTADGMVFKLDPGI